MVNTDDKIDPPPPPPPPRRTLKDLTSPSFDQQKFFIDLDNSIEIKSQLIHWLPKFKGLHEDDPNKYLLLFQHSLPQGSITSWNDMQKVFLEKYFPASKAATIRKAISGIEQIVGETLYDYWERYKKLLSSCPHHQISEQLIVQYFYDGMLQSERNLIDAASGGALTNKNFDEATELIENMVANTQKFNTRCTSMDRRVDKVSSSSHLEKRMSNMENMMQQMAAVLIPTYEEEAEQQATTSSPYARQGGFQQQFQPQQQDLKEDASEKMITIMQSLSSIFQQSQQKTDQLMQKTDQFIHKAEQNQLKTDNAIRDLHTQMGQFATDVNQLKEKASTTLSSQPFVNLREHVNAVTLRSGKQVTNSNIDT
ncbi:uncharacterized protein LOC113272436 [Papaver somniferum]|uniref:uncharacterized protein LOC113272436 n=1 Tax=Papaver somniferum TaxID=3469 RepID=UPI000E6FD195|nr:uncharacterized protein LOC113272436 [Papaver somniferum]